MVEKKMRTRQTGFTLIELIVALAFIGILVVAVSGAMVFSMQTMQYNRGQLAVTSIANKKLEEIRAMQFNEIGVQGGNPAGGIPPAQNVNLDGHTYNVTTSINWVSATGHINPNWDYKEIRLSVSGNGFYSNKKTISKQVSTLVSRNSEEAPLTGSNVIFNVYRAMNYVDGSATNTPVSFVRTTVGTAEVQTNANGIALFLALTPTSPAKVSINVDPSFHGNMIVEPGTFPQEIELKSNTTERKTALVEYPSELRVRLKNAFGRTPIDLQDTMTGTLTLDPAVGDTLIHSFSGTEVDGSFSGLSADWAKIWPTGTQKLSITPIDGFMMSSNPIWDDDKNSSWDGSFDAAGSVKNVSFMVINIPTPPPGINPDSSSDSGFHWTNGNNGITIDHDVDKTNNNKTNYGVAAKPPVPGGSPVLIPYRFTTDNHTGVLKASTTTDTFYALEFYITDDLEIGSKATFSLESNKIVFDKTLTFGNKGDIVLTTLDKAVVTVGPYSALVPGQQPGETSTLLKGSSIKNDLEEPYANTWYGELYLKENVKVGEITLSAGAYYFPDGFSFKTDIAKSADDGGLIAR